uniref:ATP synthase complex subunit 8 n=2 Tax=Neochauliodes TaxID=560913 RepID=A0A7G7XR38_NEOPN|nr:ATP synthase F0 subunit 8 [Neochauliodes punctatolosus]UFZ13206.1 ATP synthase F0 subunit 8 [Neochauliodes sparsus]
MPQMAPLNWLILFIFFITLFILFNIMNYFMISPTPESPSSHDLKNHPLIWKW